MNDICNYGLLGFLVEYNSYGKTNDRINIDDYIYPVGEYCNATQAGGEIYIMPAYEKAIRENTELYRECLMRVDFDMPMVKGL